MKVLIARYTWLLCALAACVPATRNDVRPESATPSQPQPPPQPMPAVQPVLLIEDPEALAVIEARVGDFGMLAIGAREPAQSNAKLAHDPSFRALFEPLERDIASLIAKDPRAGSSVRKHSHRTFDLGWLHAASARFQLIGVANRADRRALDHSACGETRLLYRLSYDQGEPSRLPFTAAIELLDKRASADCSAAARRWLLPPLTGRALGERLTSEAGPLSAALIDRAHIRQVALNVQRVRWPSAVRPDLGGHAEYLLRAFSWDGQRYVPRRLENTPDVSSLRTSTAQRAALASFLREHAHEVDAGYVVIPDRWLAEEAVSVTPRGFSRLANRPFSQLFSKQDFTGLPFASLPYSRTPEAFLRRLDDLTCQGCHQARSVAGFHALGAEPVAAQAVNALAVSHSAHLQDELPRREAYLLALAAGKAPDEARPFSERAAVSGKGGWGARCGLGDPSFADWTCMPELHCDRFEGDALLGVCLGERGVGDPCEATTVSENADPHRDRATRMTPAECPGFCEAAEVGFPSGMCAASCNDSDPNLTCGRIAILTPFNNCLARRAVRHLRHPTHTSGRSARLLARSTVPRRLPVRAHPPRPRRMPASIFRAPNARRRAPYTALSAGVIAVRDS
jgi:hypothetical protein